MSQSSSGQDTVGSDKDVEVALASIHAKVTGVKEALANFKGKMEHESLTWPSVLDSFASVSGHTSVLMKQLCSEKMPPLHTRVLLPLEVSSDRDIDLERHTEGRVPILHHEIVPDYLRTKLDLDLEAKQNKLTAKAKEEEMNVKNKIKNFNNLLASSLEKITELKEVIVDQKSKKDSVQSSSMETKKLVSMYLNGTGLSTPIKKPLPQQSPGKMTAMMRGVPGGRMPSAVRTDMKQNIQSTVAPYSRPK